MTEFNFGEMTKSELKVYLRKNPNNTEAFYALMDKINAEPARVRYRFDDPAGDEELKKAFDRKEQAKGDVA